MPSAQLATTIDFRVKRRLDAFCRRMGLKINKFVEDAILSKIEDELEGRVLTRAVRGAEGFITLGDLSERLRKAGKL